METFHPHTRQSVCPPPARAVMCAGCVIKRVTVLYKQPGVGMLVVALLAVTSYQLVPTPGHNGVSGQPWRFVMRETSDRVTIDDEVISTARSSLGVGVMRALGAPWR